MRISIALANSYYLQNFHVNIEYKISYYINFMNSGKTLDYMVIV